MDSVSGSITKFAVDLYKAVTKNDGTNICFSPLSISTGLAMVYLGAKENTATQMENVLHFTKPVKPGSSEASCKVGCQTEGIHVAFKELLAKLTKHNSFYELSIANRLYGQKGFEFLKQYLLCTEEQYKAKLEAVDFAKDPDGSRNIINAWVKSQTNDKIVELFPKDSIETSTVLALVNAVYFKGKWKTQFKKESTSDESFYLNKNEKKQVKMMSQTGKFKLASLAEIKCRILELPYEEGLSMYILLPNDVDGLQKLETMITFEKLTSWISAENMHVTTVVLRVPQFKIENTYELTSVLKTMGMSGVFSANANLSGISTQNPLKLSTVIHKSYVEVNEEGTEAAAATGGAVVTTSLESPILFDANHPFLYCIKHNDTQTILFYGSLSSP
ncbi:serpin B4-like [Ascaphus truei]|uniref:serpin B4-like n=1 Tax=Ascaphus truei TaxID=8439 RepID=UPI003F590474